MFMYHADCIGQEKNCQYRHRVEITDEASLLEVVRHDYVCAEYQDGYRSNNNFIPALHRVCRRSESQSSAL